MMRRETSEITNSVVRGGRKGSHEVGSVQYSFIILGEEDARFLEDYRIIPYTSELGSAFYGHHLGDYVQVSFSGEEAPHACKIISIETSDYLQPI